jgi:hypothetical protein
VAGVAAGAANEFSVLLAVVTPAPGPLAVDADEEFAFRSEAAVEVEALGGAA